MAAMAREIFCAAQTGTHVLTQEILEAWPVWMQQKENCSIL